MEKFALKKEEKDLKIFFYIVDSRGLVVMAYDAFESLLKIEDNLSRDSSVSARCLGNISVKEIVESVDTGSSTKTLTIKEPEIKTFICNTLLLADKYLSNKTDRATVKRILNKIKIDE